MALNFFRQSDIEQMDVNNIPERFKTYLKSLDGDAQAALLANRPDLAEALGILQPESQKEVLVPDEDTSVLEDPFAGISRNLYAEQDLHTVLVDDMDPLEALTIPDHAEKCALHRTPFEFVEIREGGYGIRLRVCRECHRVFMEESSIGRIHAELERCGVEHTIYDLDLTNRYLYSQIRPHELKAEEKLYVPEVWIEEDPKCPIHDEKLYEIPCARSKGERKVTFRGWRCEQCGKILIRKALAADLEDQCGMNGVPAIRYESLVTKKPAKKPVLPKEVKPDYIIEDGKRTLYQYDYTADCCRLTEEDIVVVTDSVYCSLAGHRSEEVLALIWMEEKPGAKRKAYLFVLGYCSQCRKYYMDAADYKAAYRYGRPEATVIRDFDDTDYQITSGNVFNMERDHLQDLEYKLSESIENIRHQPDYVSMYKTGDYDDGGLAFAKDRSRRKYGKRLEELERYMPKPYMYRVDITADTDTETYYIGAEDVVLDGKTHVISANSDFGHELINYQTTKVEKDGLEYAIKLSRTFDIDRSKLYGYVNLRTDEDIIFKSGITDPFLVRVLNMRKKQHNLTDIFVTIQENQNRIVNADFSKNLVVQGCAGSGKTMVLLHRLSSLAYRQKEFDFSKLAMILTPNDQFNLHIQGLAQGLQIDNIERNSVEQYYINMLTQYDKAFSRDARKISSEMIVQQDFVDYIYSDVFLQDLKKAYEKILSERNALADMLDDVTVAMERPKRKIDFNDNPGALRQMQFAADALADLVRQADEKEADARKAVEKVYSRSEFLQKAVPKAEQEAVVAVREATARVKSSIAEYLEEKQSTVRAMEEELHVLEEEQLQVQQRRIMPGRRVRLDDLESRIQKLKAKQKNAKKQLEKEQEILARAKGKKTDAEKLSWMRQAALYIGEAKDEIRLCESARDKFKNLSEELQGKDRELQQAEAVLARAKQAVYSDEIKRTVQYLLQQLDQYTVLNFYKLVFDEATALFREQHKIQNIQGDCHRYDLYAQLLFAIQYYNTVHGQIRFMCVDEGQDLAFNEYRLISMLNQGKITFNIFGDTNQLIKPGRGIGDWSSLVRLYEVEQYILNENYRNTNQITGFCNRNFIMNVLQTGVDGPVVQEIPRKDLEKSLTALHITTERIAILVSRQINKSDYLDTKTMPATIKNAIGSRIESGRIALMYVDEVKGIEFDKVYVDTYKMKRNEKYIAYTRALTELVLVVEGDAA